MKIIDNLKEQLKNAQGRADKLAVVIYFVTRFLILLCMARQLWQKNYFYVLLCLLSLVLISLPEFIERKAKILLPAALEIAICFFVYAAEILGEISNFYYYIPIWDTVLHTANGFLAASVGFGIIDLININTKRIYMTPIFVVITAFCFSMTIGILWEFYEYECDRILHTDMQKDNIVSSISSVNMDETNSNKSITVRDIGKTVVYDKSGNELAVFENGYLDIGLNDTMKDLFVNMIGAFVFSVYGYLYLKKNERYRFVEKFIIKNKAD